MKRAKLLFSLAAVAAMILTFAVLPGCKEEAAPETRNRDGCRDSHRDCRRDGRS